MSYQVVASPQGDVLQIKLTGETDGHADEIARDVFAQIEATHARKLLIDTRQLTGRLGLGSMYLHMQRYPRNAPHIKTAVVDLPEHTEFATFHELAASNLGYSIRYFEDPRQAWDWLKT